MDNRRDIINIIDIFKHQFIQSIDSTLKKAALLSAGNVTFSPSWKDWAGIVGINTTATVSTGIMSGLIAAGVITTVLAPQVTVPLMLAGIGANVGYTIYRFNKKRGEYAVVSSLCDERDTHNDIETIADTLISLYKNSIEHMTVKDAKNFAKRMAAIITYVMMKGKIESIDTLLDAPSLHALILSFSKLIPKDKLQTILAGEAEHNMRGFITKAAIYCEENGQMYVEENTRPEKYGLIRFEKKEEVDEFMTLAKQDFTELSAHKINQLLKHSIFRSESDSDTSSSIIEESSDSEHTATVKKRA